METLFSNEFLNYVMLAAVFVGTFLLVTGLSQLFRPSENNAEARNRRLRMIQAGVSKEEVFALLRSDANSGLLNRLPFVGNLPRMLSMAGVSFSAKTFLVLCLLGSLATAAVASLLLPIWQTLPLAFTLGFVVPLLVLKNHHDKRKKALTAQLPDALDLLARGLRIGHPLNASISSVASEMPDPIGSEFGLIFDQINFGDDLPDAVQDFADRVGSEDAQYLAASIAIQYGTGGDLARIVTVLATVIRKRISLRNRIMAISAEGRLSGLLLSIIPLVIIGMMSINAPGYYTELSDDPTFIKLAILVVVLMVANVFCLHKLVNFRV
ncbi:type II secretion system F family protein [Ruegeria sp. WL0004]|uniref:Type II secretion system F family protein n=1 Tax=Ruegeria marisflavi TaxID=2984152 RepID=A0ABT2WWH6_9RHOB|nr:type II secretion system F family protein [Ruegeria sp. WL0004]MCU9840234.1 type II secretion system F family protein [Ruegeria sp. WL0004]